MVGRLGEDVEHDGDADGRDAEHQPEAERVNADPDSHRDASRRGAVLRRHHCSRCFVALRLKSSAFRIKMSLGTHDHHKSDTGVNALVE